ncbi:MAG: hypothetical protein AB7G34_03540 [Hyphomicrobiales bacterium]
MRPQVRFAGRTIRLPASQWSRIGLGILLILGGLAGFLPVLGFWMIPLGLFVLSYDLPMVRRWRRQAQVAWERWRQKRAARPPASKNEGNEGK